MNLHVVTAVSGVIVLNFKISLNTYPTLIKAIVYLISTIINVVMGVVFTWFINAGM